MAEHQTLRSMRPPMLAGMFRDRASAERAYASLTHRGYTKVEITLVMSHEARKRHFGHLHDTDLGSKAAEGDDIVAAVSGLRAVLTGPVAAGVVALPGIIVMGPIAAPLNGADGVAGVGLLGALIGAGIPEDHAKLYEVGIREGNIVMGVSPKNEGDALYFEHEWRNYRGDDVYRPTQRAA